jgi:hypothetical protein
MKWDKVSFYESNDIAEDGEARTRKGGNMVTPRPFAARLALACLLSGEP